MQRVNSHDGTPIAYDRQGAGPAIILVDGALTTRSSGSKPELARRLAEHFSVYCYDRRGRGDSGDHLPYAVERECEDIAALIAAAGGTAGVYGHSSGAALVLAAALRLGKKARKIALYEAPYNDDPQAQQTWRAYIGQLTAALAANQRGEAVALFMRLVGTPADQIEAMRHAPMWPGLEALAPTLAYDHTALLGETAAVPAERAARVGVPALVMAGGASFPFMRISAQTLSQALPQAQLVILDGQRHEVSPEALAPVLVKFFSE